MVSFSNVAMSIVFSLTTIVRDVQDPDHCEESVSRYYQENPAHRSLARF